jgi:hypothetical protein
MQEDIQAVNHEEKSKKGSAANLLDERIADLLDQHAQALAAVVCLGVLPDQQQRV